MIIQGNNLDVLRSMSDNSVDSIVTDPPYGLSFMGKKWDYDVPSIELWSECLRVLKPGGHLLAFAGTRTQHRMAVRIEDAGFEIRDMIAWVYGSGFPKSLNISKKIDQLNGIQGEYKFNGGLVTRDNKTDHITQINKTLIQRSEPNPMMYQSVSDQARQYEGWGSALKPALEPITLARKPISEKSIAENVLKWNTGGINIDGCRVGTEDKLNYGTGLKTNVGFKTSPQNNERPIYDGAGRFPANFIHDGSDEVLELFPMTSKAYAEATNGTKYGDGSMFKQGGVNAFRYDMGGQSASRFFYVAKASKSERNFGLEGFEDIIRSDRMAIENIGASNPRNRTGTPKQNHHPTVKPIKLMQ